MTANAFTPPTMVVVEPLASRSDIPEKRCAENVTDEKQ
jgi:hypothetical protein